MIRLRHKLFIYALRVLDQVLLYTVLFLTIDLTNRHAGRNGIFEFFEQSYESRFSLALTLLGVLWILMFNLLVHYETNRLKTLRTQLADVIKANTAAAFLLLAVGTFFDIPLVTNQLVLSFWAAITLLGSLSRITLKQVLMMVRLSGYNSRHMLIIGFNDEGKEIARRIDASPVLGYKICGFISEHVTGSDQEKNISGTKYEVIGHIWDLKAILENEPIDEIMICLPFIEQLPAVTQIIKLAQELGVVARLFPDDSTARILSQCHIEQFEGHSIVTLFREQMLLQLLGKRVMDFTLSLIGLILLSPLMITVALLIKLDSKGPVFFVQPRVGMNRRTFNLMKFRSMFIDAEKRKAELAHLNEMDGPVFKIKNDPRITRIGRIIRKTSIDELPQLFNVLTGHMSLVGPRPPLMSEVNRYEWLYQKRLSTKPGITCIWQISGRNEVSFEQWMEMDRYYIENWSLWLDIEILLKTIPVVLLRKGAS